MVKAECDRTKRHDELFPQDIAARSETYLCAFYGLSFGENKPHLGSYRNGWLDLVYLFIKIPALIESIADLDSPGWINVMPIN